MEELDPGQAVVLCDSFETRFGPLSIENPKALFPFGPEPLVLRVLRFLDCAGVKHAILLCTAGSGDVTIRRVAEEFCRNGCSMKVDVIAAGTCLTLGDALRDLDSRKLVTRHDFLLVRGDVLGSLDLSSLLVTHKKNVRRDKGALMTMVMVPRSFESSSPHEMVHDDVFVTERGTGKLLHRQNLSISPKLEFSAAFDDVDVRNDVQESGVYVCGPGVPPAFSDNFDFQTMDDFVRGILNSEEILGNSLYLHVAGRADEFVCRLDSVSAWNRGFEDLCNRRAVPLFCPGPGDLMDFWNVYRSPSSQVDSSAVLVKNVYLSQDSVVRSEASLDSCFLGPKVEIGEGSRVKSSQIWAKTLVGRGVVIHDSIIGEDVTIGDGVVCENCIIGPSVVVKRKPTMFEPLRLVGLRLTAVVPEDAHSSDDGSEDGSCAEHYSVLQNLSTDSRAFRFHDKRETADDAAFRRKERQAALTRVTSWLVDNEDEPEGSDSGDGDETGSEFEDQLADREEKSGLRQFEREVADSLVRGLEESLPVDNLVLEINSSKHAYNIGFSDVVRVTTREVLRRMNPDINKDAVKNVMGRLWGVIANYVKKGDTHVLECMKGIEEYAAETVDFRGEPMLMVLNLLYSKDVLSETGILEWYASHNFSRDPSIGADIRSKVKRFIDWLETAETESEEESGEDEGVCTEMNPNDRMFTVRSVNADHKDIIHDVAYNFYGNRMATCSSDQQVKVWDKNEAGVWECTAHFKAHNGSVWKVTWAHPEFGQILATCSFDRTASVWEEIRTDAGESLSSHWVKRYNIVDSRTDATDIKFAPRHLGLQLAVSSSDGFIRIYDAPDIMNLTQWGLSAEINCKVSVSCLSWSPSYGKAAMIAVGSDAPQTGNASRAFIYEWNDTSRAWLKVESLPVDTPVHDLAFAAQSGRSYHLLAIAAGDLKILALRTAVKGVDSGSGSSVTSQSNGGGGGSVGGTTPVSKFDVRIVLESNSHSPSAWRVSWNCTGSILSSAGDDGIVRLWKHQPSGSWACILTLRGDGSKVKSESPFGAARSEPVLRPPESGIGASMLNAGAHAAANVAARFYKMGGVSQRDQVVWH